jgi:hypothetical protein
MSAANSDSKSCAVKTYSEDLPRPDRALTKTASKMLCDPLLDRLVGLWPSLSESERKMLVTAAESIANPLRNRR